MADKAKKGRATPGWFTSTANPRAKLSAEEVSEIWRLKGTASYAEIGRRFGVGKTAIANIYNGWVRCENRRGKQFAGVTA